jgi:hypothetical protein
MDTGTSRKDICCFLYCILIIPGGFVSSKRQKRDEHDEKCKSEESLTKRVWASRREKRERERERREKDLPDGYV